MKISSLTRRSRWVPLLLVLAGCSALAPLTARAQSQDSVTVAFLYNFARFVEWPANAFRSAEAPFVVGFVGRPVLADAFAEAVQGKNVNGREFVIRKLDGVKDIAACHIVFVGDAGAAASAIAAGKAKPVLCVGEGDAFLGVGGMIAFSRDGSRLVFDVNPAAITAATLTPADKLTKAARAVKKGS